jgi:8-oxo-dGTP pyrophosphatase MutT (NUDIX family)
MSELYEVVITAIVVKKDKYLIMRRSANKKRFPLKWTLPGGHLELADFTLRPKDSEDYWYNVLEDALRREIKEEAGIKIKNIDYVTSLATIHAEGSPSLVISCLAQYASGRVQVQADECDDFAWASLKEAKKYDLIGGIYDELIMADMRRLGKRVVWKSRSK